MKTIVKKKTSNTVMHNIECKECVKTTCGRVLELAVLQRMMRKPIYGKIGSAVNSNSTKSSTNSIDDRYSPIESTNERWINTTLTHIKGFFNAYKRVDENLDA